MRFRRPAAALLLGLLAGCAPVAPGPAPYPRPLPPPGAPTPPPPPRPARRPVELPPPALTPREEALVSQRGELDRQVRETEIANLVFALGDPDPAAWRPARQELLRRPAEAVAPLRRALTLVREEDLTPAERSSVAPDLRFSRRWYRLLRIRSAQALAAIGEPAANPDLVGRVENPGDNDVQVRGQATGALAPGAPSLTATILEAMRADEPLMPAMESGTIRAVRQAGEAALPTVTGTAELDLLINGILDDDPDIGRICQRSLCRITGEDFGFDHSAWRAWLAENRETFVAPADRVRRLETSGGNR